MAIRNSTLSYFFQPKSIAIVGASRRPGKVGHEVLRNLRLSGYRGKIYPVNPFASSILGFSAYENLESVPGDVDLAVVALPARSVERAMSQCAKKRVRAAIILTTGFSDKGNVELERKAISIARASGIRVLGPDSFGIFASRNKLNCTFGQNNVCSGGTAFVSQSCAIGLSLMNWTTDKRFGVSSIVSTGTKSDVGDADLIDYLAEDEGARSILLYMEGVSDERKFFESARRAVAKKPVIAIKSGSSKRGAMAALSHTGSIVGQDTLFTAASKEAGVIRAATLTEAFDWSLAFNENPVPNGENVVIMTNCGALGVLAADRSDFVGLNLMEMPKDLKSALHDIVPYASSLNNPLDLSADVDHEVYRRILRALHRRDDVHGIIVLALQTHDFDPTLAARALIEAKSELLESEEAKPTTACFSGGELADIGCRKLVDGNVAAYPTLERAVDAMNALVGRYRLLRNLQAKPKTPLRASRATTARGQQ